MNKNIDKIINKLKSSQNDQEDKDEKRIVPIVNIPRHPLMAAIENKHFKQQKKEVLLDAELGLENQCAIDTIDLLKEDINELTSSANYYEVNQNILNKLFKVDLLKFQCLPYNFMVLIGSIFKVIKTSVICLIGMVASLAIVVFMADNVPTQYGTTFSTGAFWYWALFAIMIIVTVVFLRFSINKLGFRIVSNNNGEKVINRIFKFEFDFLTVRLTRENLKETSVKIPYGAKLKLREAMETNIFENFKIVYPTSFIEHTEKTFIFSRRPLDPAIIGISSDNRQYMIVYWDVEKDIDKTLRDIKVLTKFKLANKR